LPTTLPSARRMIPRPERGVYRYRSGEASPNRTSWAPSGVHPRLALLPLTCRELNPFPTRRRAIQC
jgi:hypothetical protein